MSAKDTFISEIERLLENNTINEEAMEYFEKMKNSGVITEKGAAILKVLQSQPADYVFTSKMLAEQIGSMSSRSVSGTLKKLISDGLVEKVNTTSPISYRTTEIGYKFEFDKTNN